MEFTDGHGIAISEEEFRDLELIYWHVDHTFECGCLRMNRAGSEISGTGCEEERLVWEHVRIALGHKPRKRR